MFLIKRVHSLFFVTGCGYHWKLSVDGSPILGLSTTPNHDDVTALCVYKIVNRLTGVESKLMKEIHDLENIVNRHLNDKLENILSEDELGMGMN